MAVNGNIISATPSDNPLFFDASASRKGKESLDQGSSAGNCEEPHVEYRETSVATEWKEPMVEIYSTTKYISDKYCCVVSAAVNRDFVHLLTSETLKEIATHSEISLRLMNPT